MPSGVEPPPAGPRPCLAHADFGPACDQPSHCCTALADVPPPCSSRLPSCVPARARTGGG
eukprot:8466377-Lingulodinium_polyedra.AAC.1